VTKFSASAPKGDGNGFDGPIASEMIRDVMEGRRSRPRAAIVLFGSKEVKIGEDGEATLVLKLLRVEPLTDPDHFSEAERILHREWEKRSGKPMLPFDLEKQVRDTFAGMVSDGAQDEIDEKRRENMSPADELREHLKAVHGCDAAQGMSDTEAKLQHEADHAEEEPGFPPHAQDWHGWTRLDLETALADADDEVSDDPVDGAHPAESSFAPMSTIHGDRPDPEFPEGEAPSNDDADGLPEHLMADGDSDDPPTVDIDDLPNTVAEIAWEDGNPPVIATDEGAADIRATASREQREGEQGGRKGRRK
jgi:hypothetical protein